MKINWGHSIIIVYAIFVGGILLLAYNSSQQKFDLVQKDYYGEELKYQKVIDASQHAKELGGDVTMEVHNGHLNIKLPDALKGKLCTGLAHLYFAADEQKDIRQSFTSNNGEINIELLSTTKGNYTLKLQVEKEGAQFYYEQKIFL